MMNGHSRSADDRVLDIIFNPELPAGDPEHEVGGDVVMDEGSVEEEEESAEVSVAKEKEVEAVKVAEAGRLEDALQLLTAAITMAPAYASPYNNRAQVHRLCGNVSLALEDLNSALQLCGGHGKVGVQAYCQRGLIRRLEGSDEEAKADFTAAARMGSKFARKQLVQMNPYAALCGQMLSEAFEKIRRGEQGP